MLLGDLFVIHQDKRTSKTGLGLEFPLEGKFFLDSCQRKLWLGVGSEPVSAERFATFSGEAAYEFLLRVATGLESSVAGETDIFGQLKNAWAEFRKTDPKLARELSPWIQSLFEDVKEIRSRFLANLGGVSYGSLVRLLLKPLPTDSVLLVGAGELAKVVAPYLTGSELLLCNRNESRRDALYKELCVKGARSVRVLDANDAEEVARSWRQATYVVLCVPIGEDHSTRARDEEWIAHRRLAAPHCKTLHLGGLRGQGTEGWERLSGYLTLNDLFELKDGQSNVRDIRLREAAAACRERARLRLLGRSLSIAHGWEDLAIFM